MKPSILLVANGDRELNTTVAEAAKRTGHEIRTADSSRETFAILGLGLDDVDLAIVDVDPILHSLAILEALSYSDTAPPSVALVEVDEAEATPLVRRHGAAACLKKPFGADELATLIEKVCAYACRKKPLTCDKWGHLRASGTDIRNSRRELVPNLIKTSSQVAADNFTH